MSMKNKAVRSALFETGIKMYELADLLGKSVPTITRMFQKEMSQEEQQSLVKIIYKEHEKRAKSND